MAMASTGEVRRRKNPKAANPTISHPSSSTNDGDSSTLKKRRRTDNEHLSDDNDETPSSTPSRKEYDEYAWFAVFLMALCYFLVTRGGQSSRGGVLSSFSKPYHVVSSSVAVAKGKEEEKSSDKLLRSIFYIDKSQREESELRLAPNHRLEVILSSPPDILEKSPHDECKNENLTNKQKPKSIPYFSHLSSTTWVHDEELGRGYLLLADAGRSGRIWRWEVGGGPITIGRSLHMERSGCRSGLWVDANRKNGNRTCPENLFGDSFRSEKTQKSCNKASTAAPFNPPLLGSASLAVELTRNAERSSSGANIIVAEWGERRIVRVEGATGARTPLVTLVPNPNDDNNGQEPQWKRLFRPNHLTYTPFGDLLFSDSDERDLILQSSNITVSHFGAVYRRKEAVHVPPILAEESRDAHGWTSTTDGELDGDDTLDVLFRTSGLIEGMALGSDLATLFVLVTARTNPSGWTKTVYKLRLGAEEDDEDSDDESGDKAENDADEVTVFYEMTSVDCKDNGVDGDPYSSIGSKLAVDEKGTVYLIACSSSVTLLDKDDGQVVGTLTLDDLQESDKYPKAPSIFTSISFGEDGYLYITSPTELMRVKSRVGGMALPTDLVVPPPLKSKKDDYLK